MNGFPRLALLTAATVLGLTLATLLNANPAGADTRRALLIGVSDYPDALAVHVGDLEGPRNDVLLLHDVLRQNWGADAPIQVLADTLDRAAYETGTLTPGDPTRAAILAAFDRLVDATGAGDEVLIYITGHGAQIPAEGDEEDDGLDEIFLPGDFRVFTDATGAVSIENHLSDDEIGAVVAQLIGKSAFVWLVVDSCHSGTMERAARPEARPRFVNLLVDDPSQLIDLNRPAPGAAPAPSVEVRDTGAGAYVGFFAAQPFEVAWEYPLPRNADPAAQRTHGLLTWSLVQAIRDGNLASYAELARAVQAAFWSWGNGASVPMFAGALGSPPMLDSTGLRSWSLDLAGDTLTLEGGQLDGIAAGTVLAVSQGTAAEDAALFYLQVGSAGADRAAVEIIADDPAYPDRRAEALARDGLRDSATMRRLWFEDRLPSFRARIAVQPVAFTLRVARPAEEDAGVAPILNALDGTPPEDLPVAIKIVPPGAEAALRLRVAADRLWIVPDLAPFTTDGPARPYSLPLDGLDADAVIAALRQFARARNLIAVAEAAGDTPTARALQVELRVRPQDPDPATGACATPPAEEARALPDTLQDPAAPGQVGHCDQVFLALTNTGTAPLDVSPFYIGPHAGIYYLRGYRDAAFFGLRIAPGETRIVSYTENTRPADGSFAPTGAMRLVLFAVEADPGSAYPRDFRYLEAALPPPEATVRSGARSDAMAGLLAAAGYAGGATRSALVPGTGGAGAVIVPLETSR